MSDDFATTGTQLYSQFIHKSRYARWLDDENRRETWDETVDRYVNFFKNKYPDVVDYQEIRDAIYNVEVMPSMRALMTAGPALNKCNVSGYNCLAGDTLVTTLEYGIIPIQQLAGMVVNIVDGNGNWTPAMCSSFGKQELFEIELTTAGTGSYVIKATSNHDWILHDGTRTSTEDLAPGSKLAKVMFPPVNKQVVNESDYADGIRHGLIYGDGTAQYKESAGQSSRVITSNKRCAGFSIRICCDQEDLLPFFSNSPISYPKSYNGNPVVYLFNESIDLKSLPDLSTGFFTPDYLRGFIRGWLAADGSVSAASQVTLAATKEGCDWINLVGPSLGFVSTGIYKFPSETNFGTRKTDLFRIQFDRNILSQEDFLIKRKADRFKVSSHIVSKSVKSITPTGLFEEVFCFEVPTTRSFLLTNNVLTGNCSYVTISHPRAFDEMMYCLMSGVGVGFSVERQYISKLPEVAEKLYPTDSVIVVPDSRRGWCKSFKELISLLYSGCIPTWDLSKLRKEGERLKTFGGRSSGPRPLDELFKFTVSTFKKSAGRKLTSLECHDLCCKIAEIVVAGGVRRSALISLSNPSDDRMRDAKAGQWWVDNGQRALSNNSASYTEKPDFNVFLKEWQSLYASKSGERGFFSRYAAQKKAAENGLRSHAIEYGCNPCCFTSDMLLLTSDGYVSFGELAARNTVSIVNHLGNTTEGKVWSSGKKQVYSIHFWNNECSDIICTPDHRFMTTERLDLEAKDLIGHRIMPYIKFKDSFDREHVYAGFIQGDGQTTDLLNPTKVGICVNFGKDDYDVKAFLGIQDSNVNVYSREAADIAVAFNLDKNILPLRKLPENPSLDFLTGLFSANGSVLAGHRIALKTTCIELANQLVDVLIGYGFSPYITTNKEKKIAWSNGDYVSKESYDVNLASYADMLKFAKDISFIQGYKVDKLEELLIKKAPKVRNIVTLDEQEVFDFTEPETHWGVVAANESFPVVAHNSEIILRPEEFCNLSEVIVRSADTLEDLKRKVRIATIIGTLQSTLTDFAYLRSSWKKNCEEERLLGVSLTGIQDHKVLGTAHGNDILEEWLTEMKDATRQANAEAADKLGISHSTAITTVKPSGTVSQLTNTASGIHARFSKYYIRRVRADINDPLAQFMVESGFPFDVDVTNPKSLVFDFPIASPDNAKVVADVSAIDQLKIWKIYQDYWCDHKPSCTVYYSDDEFLEVGSWLWNNFDDVSGISFLPKTDHIYQQAPYEEISKEEYLELETKIPKSIDWVKLSSIEKEDHTTGSQTLACSGNSCDIVDLTSN